MRAIHSPPTADDYSLVLKQIADVLLVGQGGDGALSRAVTDLYSMCSSITGISESSNHAEGAEETRLPNGHAISPRDAARCVLDYRRTSKFLRGIHAAILEAQKRFPHTAIEILYAGCGPFAPLAIPLTTRFSSDEIQFTLLDIHKRSLDAAQSIFQALGLTTFVRDYVLCDATSYQREASQVVHIVLVEAMQAALEKEPQVAITMNLVPQLCSGGIFIPERITVDACLCDLTKEFATLPGEDYADGSLDESRVKLGSALELTAETCRNLVANGSTSEDFGADPFPKVIFEVPQDLDGEFHLMLLTTITVFDSIVLGDNESGLTSHRILHDLGKVRSGTRIELAYHSGSQPGFKYRSL